jgi:hypothetical protein
MFLITMSDPLVAQIVGYPVFSLLARLAVRSNGGIRMCRIFSRVHMWDHPMTLPMHCPGITERFAVWGRGGRLAMGRGIAH